MQQGMGRSSLAALAHLESCMVLAAGGWGSFPIALLLMLGGSLKVLCNGRTPPFPATPCEANTGDPLPLLKSLGDCKTQIRVRLGS